MSNFAVFIFLNLAKAVQNQPLLETDKSSIKVNNNPANIYMLKVNNGNSRKRYEICSKLAIKTPGRRQWRRSGVLIVNFEHISNILLLFLLLTLNSKCLLGKHLINVPMNLFEASKKDNRLLAFFNTVTIY